MNFILNSMIYIYKYCFRNRVRSPIDHFPMDGIRNSRIHYAGQRSSLFRLRWTDLFF
ncbi:unnamed protein product, partial [Rotaria sordida]